MRKCIFSHIAPSWRRPFGAAAPWNVPVAGLSLHADSATYIDRLWDNGQTTPGNWHLSFGDMGYGDWTFTVYNAVPGNHELYTISVTYDWGLQNGAQVPWAPGWVGTDSDDAQAIVLKPETGEEWDLWMVSNINHTNKTFNIGAGQKCSGSYWTKDSNWSPIGRGAGIDCYAMLPEAKEVEAGEILHALTMSIPNTDGTAYVAPATKLEHPENPAGVPEGMRFSLNITDQDIETWIGNQPGFVSATTKTTARKFARCLRDYGFFITDTGGAQTIECESWVTGDPVWTQLGMGKDLDNYYPDLILATGGLITKARIRCYVPSDEY